MVRRERDRSQRDLRSRCCYIPVPLKVRGRPESVQLLAVSCKSVSEKPVLRSMMSCGTERCYGASGETSYQGVKGKVAGRKPADQRLLHSKDRFSTSRRKGEGAPKPDRTSRRARGRQDRFAPDGWPCGQS